MSEIKALDKLRKVAGNNYQFTLWQKEFNQAVAGVEREIAERFMEVPVDADGVPIRVGDMLESEHAANSPFKAESMEYSAAWTIWDRRNGATRWPSECHHVKPRTVESLVSNFADEVWNAALDPAGMTYSDSGLHESEARLCAEIRELLGGDAK